MHTCTSKDSIFPLHLLLLKCKITKTNVVGITDHNAISGAAKAQAIFKKHGVRVIVGEEVMTRQGEIIGLFLSKAIPAGLTPEETIREIRAQNGIVWLPHPYDEKRYKTVLRPESRTACAAEFDAAECYNGRNNKSEYADKQSEIVKELGCISVVGSDAHTFFEVGRNYALMPDFDTQEEFVESLKLAQWKTKPCIGWIHFYTKIVRVLKKCWRKVFHGTVG